MNELTGRTLGSYQLLEELGRGGMAIVYRAYQPSLNRRVAIKVLPAALAIDPDFVQRFLHEARAAASLDHPNIVTVHDVGEQDGTYYIVMQELQGESLNTLIRREGQLPLQRASTIIAQVASALDYAHSRGFVHRDVKPGNIIVGPGDRAVLTDFGIAKALTGTRLTQSGVMIGTPQYMAPEQIKGESVGPATDIYALGIVLYEMLTGRVPFDADSATAVMYKQVHEQPAPARLVVPSLPPAVDQVLASALAKNPAERFRSATAMAAALSGGRTGQIAASVTSDPVVIGNTPQVAHQPAGASTPRNLLVLSGVVIVVIALLGVLMAIAGGRPDESAPEPSRAAVIPSPTSTLSASTDRDLTTFATRAVAITVPPDMAVTPIAISRQAVNTYTGPNRAFPEQGQLSVGDPKEILGRTVDSAWLLLCCIDGDPAWVEAFLVDVSGALDRLPVLDSVASPPAATPTAPPAATPTPSAPEFVVEADTARVRSGPGTGYAEVGQLRQSEAVVITGKNADASWWQVCCVDGQQGWIRVDLGRARGTLDEVTTVVVLPAPEPTPCVRSPGPTFGRVWDRNSLGCPLGDETGVLTAYEGFENGFMMWRQDDDGHYAAYNGGAYAVFYYPPAEPPNFSCPDAAQLGKPRRGFSKVWCENPQVRQRIGNALEDEIGDYRPLQVFENGFMIYLKERSRIYIFFADRSWREVG